MNGTVALMTPQGDWTDAGIEAFKRNLMSGDEAIRQVRKHYGVSGVVNLTIGNPSLRGAPPGCSPSVMWWVDKLDAGLPGAVLDHPDWVGSVALSLRSDTGAAGESLRRKSFYSAVFSELDQTVEDIANDHGLPIQYKALSAGKAEVPESSPRTMLKGLAPAIQAIAERPVNPAWEQPLGGCLASDAAATKALAACVELIDEALSNLGTDNPAKRGAERARLCGRIVDVVNHAGRSKGLVTFAKNDTFPRLSASPDYASETASLSLNALVKLIESHGGTREQQCAAVLATGFAVSPKSTLKMDNLRHKYGTRIFNLVQAVSQRAAVPRRDDAPHTQEVPGAYWAAQPPAAKSMMCALVLHDLDGYVGFKPVPFESSAIEERAALVNLLQDADLPTLWRAADDTAVALLTEKRKEIEARTGGKLSKPNALRP